MDLIDKFSAVEIKADNRISQADKDFCLRHQDAFDKAKTDLQKLADMMEKIVERQKSALDADNSSPYGYYINGEWFKCDPDHVYRTMESNNRTFINTIVRYFEKAYHVDLDSHEIMEHLIPAAPQDPTVFFCSHKTEEEANAYKAKLKEYHSKRDEYEEILRNLPIKYEQIVNEIFVQLGGFSFQEQAMNEFLSKCCGASHRYRSDKEEFEVKNDTLRLTGYWCRCKDDSWRSYPEWEPTEALRVILNAIVHYDIGQLDRGAEWFPELFKYDTKENVFPINNLQRVKNIKLFKNGRVDIKFKDAVSVQEFVEKYLRLKK